VNEVKRKVKKLLLGMLLSIVSILSVTAMEYTKDTIIFNGIFSIGSFSAGEYDGGSVFLGGLLSADWIPNGKTGLSYGIESGLLAGKKQESDSIIFGIPIIFRIGWYPAFLHFSNFNIFILGKIGWAFGIWGQNADKGSTPNGIVCGIDFGGKYTLTPRLCAYAEIGYNYYGLARNSKYPEYPLGYGSGKIYTSVGLSYKLQKSV
jgi:hypothetical protein